MKRLTEAEAQAIYTILVTVVGCSEAGRDYFCLVHTHEDVREFRIGGTLGFGGKFWGHTGIDGTAWKVDFYTEDSTPERVRVAQQANFMLAALQGKI
jgi:hypothetical protein